MATVKVILQQNVPSLGQAGEVKQVAPGYFRNFLLPRGLAVEASKAHMSALQSGAKSRASQQARALDHATTLAQRIADISVQIPVRLGGQGRIHGSVTNKDIAEALSGQAGIQVDRHKIVLEEPLKAIGTHAVGVRLEQGVEAQLKVELVPESEPATTT